MKLLVTTHLPKKCLPWYLVNKQKSAFPSVKFLKTQGYTKKPYLSIKGHLYKILLKGVLFRGKLQLDFNMLLLPWLYFSSFTAKKKHKLQR